MRDRWREELAERFADDPGMIFEQASRAQSRGWDLLNAMRKAPDAEKEAHFSELETHVKQSLAFLEKNRTRMSEHDFPYHRGAYVAALGSALLDWGKFDAAEPLLREAMAARKEAEAKAKNPTEAGFRRWDAADSQGRLGLAVYRQGREDEGRKLCRESAETLETIAREQPTCGRWRDAGTAWRRNAELFTQPGFEAERLAVLEKAATLAREGVRMAEAAPSIAPGELAGCRSEAGWTLLTLGWTLRGAKRLPEAEAALKEALAVSGRNVAAATPGAEVSRVVQLSNIRYDLAQVFIDTARPDEARKEITQTEESLRQFEEKAGRTESEFRKARERLVELRRRLPE